MVIEQALGGDVARLPVAVFARKLIAMGFQRLIGELFERFPELAVLHLGDQLRYRRDLGRRCLDFAGFVPLA